MKSINMHEAKTRLPQLFARAAKGEAFIIAKAGKPVARVTAIDSPEESQQKRMGFKYKGVRSCLCTSLLSD